MAASLASRPMSAAGRAPFFDASTCVASRVIGGRVSEGRRAASSARPAPAETTRSASPSPCLRAPGSGIRCFHSQTLSRQRNGDPNVLPPNPARRFIDTHAHLDQVLRRKRLLVSSASWTALSSAYLFSSTQHPDSQNLAAIINVNSDPSTFSAGRVIEGFSDIVYSTWGVHPLRASLYDDDVEKKIEALMASPKSVAVGETGLDFAKIDSANAGPAKFVQKMVFARQLELAKKLDKAVSVHMRGAEKDTLEVLTRTLPDSHRIHMQCYTGSLDLAKEVMDRFGNAFFGIAGLATYAGAAEKRDDIVKYIPLQRIVFESLSPHIPPEPFRGKVGHPGLIPYIAERIAYIKDVSVDEVYEHALRNSKACYGLDIA
ncbi:hypothetical protein DFJ74DRAFT_757499 [Hyaloraphidium curvatum]|nr:hypothetical protein DFJ74DRAFT_757499 [Hyaloraphidium curvatum]